MGISLAANQTTVSPGLYDVELEMPTFSNDSAFTVHDWQARLRNITTGATVKTSLGQRSRNSGGSGGKITTPTCSLKVRVEVLVETIFEDQMYTNTLTGATAGSPVSSGENEQYGMTKWTKLR